MYAGINKKRWQMYHKIENFALNPFKLMMPKKWAEQFVEVLHESKVSPPLRNKHSMDPLLRWWTWATTQVLNMVQLEMGDLT